MMIDKGELDISGSMATLSHWPVGGLTPEDYGSSLSTVNPLKLIGEIYVQDT